MFKNNPSPVYFSMLCCLLGVTLNFACQKSASTSNHTAVSQEPSTIFHKGVGAPIDSATANGYKRNLSHQLKQRREAMITTYYLPAAVLRSLISKKEAVGICFYYGKDSSGKVHLVPVGVNQKGAILVTNTVQTTAGEVSWKLSRQWTAAFKQQYPTDVWGHFWGSAAVERFLLQGVKQVRISLGLDDQGAQKVMISDAEVASPTFEEDNLRTCPPYCGDESDVIN